MESMPAALPRDDDFMLGGLTARALLVDAGSQPIITDDDSESDDDEPTLDEPSLMMSESRAS